MEEFSNLVEQFNAVRIVLPPKNASSLPLNMNLELVNIYRDDYVRKTERRLKKDGILDRAGKKWIEEHNHLFTLFKSVRLVLHPDCKYDSTSINMEFDIVNIYQNVCTETQNDLYKKNPLQNLLCYKK
jgi:hypothetical protein